MTHRLLCLLLFVFAVLAACPAGAGEIHDAAAAGDVARVQHLLDTAPALVDARDLDGATPLHWAADRSHLDVARLLVSRKATIDARKPDGVTPLHVAAALGRRDIAEALLAAGSDIDAPDRLGRTALSLARGRRQAEIAALLESRGAIAGAVDRGYGREQPVAYWRSSADGCPVNVICADLDDARVTVSAAVAQGGIGSGESFGSFIRRLQPTAAINGTFFCKNTQVPVGDIVIDGKLVHFGGMGTALCIAENGKASCVTVEPNRRMDWREYRTVIACGPRLLKDGAISVNARAEGFRDPHVLGSARRMAVGITARNKLLMVSTLRSVTLEQLAGMMRELGCADAVNFDGGSSIAMYSRGRVISSPGRKLTNVLVVYEM